MNNAENRSGFIHDLVQEEFRTVLTSCEHEVPVDTEAIVVLSGPPVKDSMGEIITERSPENFARVVFGVQIANEVVSTRLGVPLDQITSEDVLGHAPLLVLNGETEQLPSMMELATENGFPAERILSLDCGPRGVGNTKTQFEVMNQESQLSDLQEITVITSAYHVPRTERTANANLKNGVHFKVIPVPNVKDEVTSTDMVKKVLGEVKRIERYSSKGDISRSRSNR